MLNPKTNTVIKAKMKRSQSRAAEAELAKIELSRGMVMALGAISGLTAAYATACVIGGIIESGGPLSFIKAFFTAVTGM